MSINPFASYNVEIPVKYRESVLKYCRTGGNKNTPEFSPFERQVDIWFMALLIAANKKLDPVKESDTYNATNGAIFSTDPERVGFMQLCVLGSAKKFEVLSDQRAVFDYCLGLSNAGMPYLFQILDDPDDRPLWLLLAELEGLAAA